MLILNEDYFDKTKTSKVDISSIKTEDDYSLYAVFTFEPSDTHEDYRYSIRCDRFIKKIISNFFKRMSYISSYKVEYNAFSEDGDYKGDSLFDVMSMYYENGYNDMFPTLTIYFSFVNQKISPRNLRLFLLNVYQLRETINKFCEDMKIIHLNNYAYLLDEPEYAIDDFIYDALKDGVEVGMDNERKTLEEFATMFLNTESEKKEFLSQIVSRNDSYNWHGTSIAYDDWVSIFANNHSAQVVKFVENGNATDVVIPKDETVEINRSGIIEGTYCFKVDGQLVVRYAVSGSSMSGSQMKWSAKTDTLKLDKSYSHDTVVLHLDFPMNPTIDKNRIGHTVDYDIHDIEGARIHNLIIECSDQHISSVDELKSSVNVYGCQNCENIEYKIIDEFDF